MSKYDDLEPRWARLFEQLDRLESTQREDKNQYLKRYELACVREIAAQSSYELATLIIGISCSFFAMATALVKPDFWWFSVPFVAAVGCLIAQPFRERLKKATAFRSSLEQA
jgi:hypothetical protein